MPIIDKPIRLIELFAGIGAQAKALENIGLPFEHYRVVEFDSAAVKSYNAIHDTSFEPLDICKVRGEDLGIVDTDKFCYVMTYSFPCQDLSNAGNKLGMSKGSGTRSGLLWEVERLLNETCHLPHVLMMENVPAVARGKNKPDFDKWCDFLESKGYTNKYAFLNAKDYGIPQNRERCFMISWLGDGTYEFPKPRPLEKIMRDYLEQDVPDSCFIDEEIVERYCEKDRQLGVMNLESAVSESLMSALEGQSFPLNTEKDGTCMTIKAQYGKNSVANFARSNQNTFGCTGVMRFERKQVRDDRNAGRKVGKVS